MTESQFLKPSPQSRIRELEKCGAAGDIPGMARGIEQLHAAWDNIDAAAQKDIQKLEAIFLSLVKLQTEGIHDE